MDREAQASPANTKEFVALWTTAKEEHFANQLAPVLHLFSGSVTVDPERAEWAARHLVRALYLAEMPEAGVPAAVEYLVEMLPRDSSLRSE